MITQARMTLRELIPDEFQEITERYPEILSCDCIMEIDVIMRRVGLMEGDGHSSDPHNDIWDLIEYLRENTSFPEDEDCV